MRTSLFCALTLSLGIANAQENSTGLEWLHLKGPVKTMESTSWSVKTGEKECDWQDGIYKLNAAGKIHEQTRYKKNGENDYIETTIYGSDGNAVSASKVNNKGVIVEKSSFSYDNKKHLTRKVSVKPSGDKTFELSLAYDGNGNLEKKTIHTYENGKTTFEETTGFTWYPGTAVIKNELHEGKVFDYEHPEKNKIFSTTLNKDITGNATDEITSSTTTANNITETIKKTFSYDPVQKKLSQEKAIVNDKVVSIRDFSYDDHGNFASEQKTFYPGKQVDKMIFTYEYDAHSNWVKCMKTIEYNGKEPEEIKVLRTLTYF